MNIQHFYAAQLRSNNKPEDQNIRFSEEKLKEQCRLLTRQARTKPENRGVELEAMTSYTTLSPKKSGGTTYEKDFAVCRTVYWNALV
jgi:hypothetical protein